MKMKFLWVLIPLQMALQSSAQKPDWEEFRMKGNECRVFVSKGGSRIIVPSGCFTMDGKPYKGPLVLSYREYKDQADFILGGLDLRYETAGKHLYLQSGGMYEIQFKTASGKDLKVTKNKRITIKFAIDPRFDAAGLEPYFFDPATKRWVKQTRFGNTKEGAQTVSDEQKDLWQDDPRQVEFNSLNDDPESDCITISIQDPRYPDDPAMVIDTVICPDRTISADSRYYTYLNDQAYKTMQIDQMGLYNYDKIFEEENSVPMFVELKTKDGKPYELKGRLFVVYKNSNSVIYYHAGDLEKNFSLIPRNDIRIFVYNDDGSILKLKQESLLTGLDIRTLRGKTLKLTLEPVKMAMLTKDEFLKATGL